MSGHSRWAQVKHKKAISDAKKGKVFSKMARLIGVAAKESGADPDMNAKLRMAIENARAVGMPKENIERAITKAAGAGADAALEEVRYEAYGPGGSALIITGITDSKNRTTNELKHLLSEHAGKLAAQGSVEWLFKKVSVVSVTAASVPAAKDDFFLLLVDSGAKEITELADSITINTNPESLDQLKQALAARGVPITETYFDYVADVLLSLAKPERSKLETLVTALEEHDDVQEVFTNVER